MVRFHNGLGSLLERVYESRKVWTVVERNNDACVGEKSDGRRVVKLHWGLAHHATAIAFFKAENVRVPQTAQ